MEAIVLSAVSTNTKQAWGLLLAPTVHQTLPRQLEASQTLPVNVTMGTREKVEAHAPSALSTHTKHAWGLEFALIVLLTLSLQLAAQHLQLVNAMTILSRPSADARAKPGTQKTVEAYARRAVSTNTKQAWGLVFALIVHLTLSLQLAAQHLQLVNAMTILSRPSADARAKPGTQKTIEAYARRAVSTNTNQDWGLLIALIVLPTLRRQLEA